MRVVEPPKAAFEPAVLDVYDRYRATESIGNPCQTLFFREAEVLSIDNPSEMYIFVGELEAIRASPATGARPQILVPFPCALAWVGRVGRGIPRSDDDCRPAESKGKKQSSQH
ncbi:hypothetical protein ACFLU6_08505 [Acidobacteriota bacterium]